MSIINFKVNENGKITNVAYNSSISVKQFILDFTSKNTDYISIDPQIYIFSIGSKLLNSKKFINTKIGLLIKENDVVDLSIKYNKEYGGELTTVDISKNKTKEFEQSENTPWYNIGGDGLNILSKCRNKECIAYNDEICINIGYVQNWDTFTNSDKIKCPCCGYKVKPLNFAFKHCSYLIQYNIKINGDYEGRTNKGTTISDKFVIFDIKESGNADYYKLVFNIEKI